MKHLLIADDEEFVRRLFHKILQDTQVLQLGVEFHFAANGQEALDVASSVPLSLITMDVSMPVKSGIEAARELRANPTRYGRPKIIAVTGVGEKREAIRAGCDDYLAKPVTNQELLDTVLAYLDPSHRRSGDADGEGSAAGPRVLLIDSDHGNLYWVQRSLRMAGYRPMLAERFSDALQLCRFSTTPNLVVIDDSVLNGAIGESEALVEELQRAKIPVIVRESQGATGGAATAWQQLAAARIPADSDHRGLLAKVDELLGATSRPSA